MSEPNSTRPDVAWIDKLGAQALDLVRSHEVTETLPVVENNSSPRNVTCLTIKPCGTIKTVLETLSTLLAVRADAMSQQKNGPELRTAAAGLDSLWSVQGINGILPRYVFLPINESAVWNNTGFLPNAALFEHTNTRYLPPKLSLAPQVGLVSSGRLTSPPIHASIVLDLFQWSQQTKDDILWMEEHFDRLFLYHDFLHEVVMRGCRVQQHDNPNSTTPCYNTVHPWETMLWSDSPLWTTALRQIETLRNNSSPPLLRNHATERINSLLNFLAECISNATVQCDDNISSSRLVDIACEEIIIRQCPFAVLDVGYAAVLWKSDNDLVQMAQLLLRHHVDHSAASRLRLQLEQIIQWEQQSRQVVTNLLWNEQRQSFMSRYVVFDGSIHEGWFVPQLDLHWLETPATATNFLALWNFIPDTYQRNAMVLHLLEKRGNESFDCGTFPLWSEGGCDGQDDNDMEMMIDPVLNYFVAQGLRRNGFLGVGNYIANSTLRLLCGLDNNYDTESSVLQPSCINATFASRFHARTAMPWATSGRACEVTSTAVAAAAYSLVHPEPPVHYVPAPPMTQPWVIVLVVMELFVAVSIGVGCLLLSLNLLRRLNAGEDFVSLLNDEGGYFSATASLESLDGNEDREGGDRTRGRQE